MDNINKQEILKVFDNYAQKIEFFKTLCNNPVIYYYICDEDWNINTDILDNGKCVELEFLSESCDITNQISFANKFPVVFKQITQPIGLIYNIKLLNSNMQTCEICLKHSWFIDKDEIITIPRHGLSLNLCNQI